MVDVLDHYRAGDDATVGASSDEPSVADAPEDPVEPGVYRVVGTDDDAVVLLRVVEDGRRVNTGAVVRVPRADLDAFEPAGNPDTGLGRLRQAPETLAERPLYAGLGLLLVAFGAYELAVAGDDDGVIAIAGGALVLWFLLR